MPLHSMIVNYLNLDRRPDREERFLSLNDGIVTCRRVAAVDGRALTPSEFGPSVVDPALEPRCGAVGNALSHKGLWEACVAQGETFTIAEDDAVLNVNFESSAERILATLPSDWDLILWGWNFDSILHVEFMPGLNEAILSFPSYQLKEKLREFQVGQFDCRPARLRNAFGLVCYSISPRGAANLLKRCFPLKKEVVPIPGLKRNVVNFTLDTVMNKYFRFLNAYACLPPLAWTENEASSSDVVAD